MNPARSREIALLLPQSIRKRKQRFDADPEHCRSYGGEILPDRFDAGLAAESATARDRSEALY